MNVWEFWTIFGLIMGVGGIFLAIFGLQMQINELKMVLDSLVYGENELEDEDFDEF